MRATAEAFAGCSMPPVPAVETAYQILAGFDVASVDGIGAIEVVLIRNVRTGHLIGINTGAMLATIALAPGIVSATFNNSSDGTPPA
jgi:hypothetical protein